jgi:hypothetical protein
MKILGIQKIFSIFAQNISVCSQNGLEEFIKYLQKRIKYKYYSEIVFILGGTNNACYVGNGIAI